MKTATPLLVGVLALGLGACEPAAPRACTEMAGLEGIRITVPPDLVAPRARVHVEVCAVGECAEATTELMPPPIGAPAGEPREAWFQRDEIQALLEHEAVAVTTEVRSGGAVRLRQEATVPVDRTWPNGRECDGEGYASVTVALDEADRVSE